MSLAVACTKRCRTAAVGGAMGVMRRVATIFEAKANKVLDRLEDPRETLEYSYQRQLEMLTQVKDGVSSVVAARKRAELQMSALRSEQAALGGQGGLTSGAEGQDGSRAALRRKAAIDKELSGLTAQCDSLRADEEKLTVASDRLAAKVEAFRVRMEAIKASYTAAEAQEMAHQVWSGISAEIGEAGIAALPRPRQRELLTQLLGSVKSITLARERLDQLINALPQEAAELEDTLSRRALDQLPDLTEQLNSLQADEKMLADEYERLAAQAETSRPQDEATPATYMADEAQQKAEEVRPATVKPDAAPHDPAEDADRLS